MSTIYEELGALWPVRFVGNTATGVPPENMERFYMLMELIDLTEVLGVDWECNLRGGVCHCQIEAETGEVDF